MERAYFDCNGIAMETFTVQCSSLRERKWFWNYTGFVWGTL